MLVRILHLFHILNRPMTLGVRAAAFDAEGRVFLVRHTYIGGWYLPGGGVDAGESAYESLERELAEEGNLAIGDAAELFGFYFNRNASRRDHVALFVCRNVSQTAPLKGNAEIAEAGFFETDALPDNTTDATRRRLAELLQGQPVSRTW